MDNCELGLGIELGGRMSKIGRLVMEIQTAIEEGIDPEVIARHYDVSVRMVNEAAEIASSPDPDLPCEEDVILALSEEPPF